MLRKLCLAAAGLVCCAGAAVAQQNLYLFRVEPLNSITTDTTNPFFVGNNISAISLLDGDLYVGGFNNTPNSASPLRVTRVNNVFGSRTFTNLANLHLDYSTYDGTTQPTLTVGTWALSVSSLDTYRRPLPGGGFEARMIVSMEEGGGDSVKQLPQALSVWNIENPAPSLPLKVINPATASQSIVSFGRAGTAWDFGTGGAAGGGIAYPTNASARNPVPVWMLNGFRGPVGIDAFSAGAFFDPFAADVYGAFNGAVDQTNTTGPRLVVNGEGNTQYRDIWFHRGNGTIVARADNTVLVVNRQFDRFIAGAETAPTANNGSTTYLLFNGPTPPYTAGTNPAPYDTPANNVTVPKYPFLQNIASTVTPIAARITNQGLNSGLQVPNQYPAGSLGSLVGYQNVGVMEGLPTEYIVWNNRTSSVTGQNFGNVFRMNRLDNGAPVTPNFIGFDGSPIASFPYTFGASSIPVDGFSFGVLDFAWDRNLQVLGVTDAGQKSVYFFSTTQPGPCTLSDGSCTLLPANVCTSTKVGGTAGAPGASCPSGACCNSATGDCTVLPRQFCASGAAGWTAGGVCSPNPCVIGSCCNPATGACTTGLPGQCASTSVFTPGGTCPAAAPFCPQSGSCCTAGACTVTFQTQCSGAGQTWTSAGTCTPDPCAPASGQCCVAGACSVTTQAACAGTWTAGGTCAVNTCPQPNVVCCRGSTCSIVATAGDCTVPAGPVVGSVVSAAAACGVNNSATAGCCFADFNKLGGVTIDDIFIYLNAWFAASEFANVGAPGTPNIDDIFIFLNAWFAGCP